jgi:DNA repair exonuclease SbcCD nuclease subunit
MVKVICTADLHIAERFDLEQQKRLLDVVILEANKRDELWILGDLFHTNRISPLELMLFIDFIKQIKVPIILIAGNHDMAAENSLLDWMPKVLPVTVSKTSMRIEREGVSVLLGHYSVEESVLGAYDIRLNSGISVNQLDVDLALLGHIHRGQHIQGTKTQVVHPGSLFYIDFNERNDTKALVEVTFDQGKYMIEHIELNPDPIVQLDITPDSDSDILKDYPSNCRVKLIVHYSDPSLNKKEVYKRFAKFLFKDLKVVFLYENKNLLGVSLQEDHKEEAGLLRLDRYLTEHTTSEIKELILMLLKE